MTEFVVRHLRAWLGREYGGVDAERFNMIEAFVDAHPEVIECGTSWADIETQASSYQQAREPRCRCCGKVLSALDRACDAASEITRPVSICTRCIPKHWGQHAHGRSASRCREFGRPSK